MDELRQRLREQALAHYHKYNGAMDATHAAMQSLHAHYPRDFCEERLHLDDEMQRLQTEMDHWRQNAIESLSLLLSLADEDVANGRESAGEGFGARRM